MSSEARNTYMPSVVIKPFPDDVENIVSSYNASKWPMAFTLPFQVLKHRNRHSCV